MDLLAQRSHLFAHLQRRSTVLPSPGCEHFIFMFSQEKNTHSCVKMERSTEVWTHFREFSPFKGTLVIVNSTEPCRRQKWGPGSAELLSSALAGTERALPLNVSLFWDQGKGQAGFIKLNIRQAQKAIKESSQHLKIIEPGPKLCTLVKIDVPPTRKGWWIQRKEWGNNLTESFRSCSLRGLVVASFYQPGRENWNKVLDYSWNYTFVCVCFIKTVP